VLQNRRGDWKSRAIARFEHISAAAPYWFLWTQAHKNQNGFIESFNGRLRDECLNVNEFATLDQARELLRAWRHDYNHHRPHGSLGHLTPSEFATQGQKTGAAAPKL
jgi:transposase InsO family protein